MRHKRLFFGSIIMLGVGVVLYFIGMLILPYGVGSYTTGWWIFGETHYYLTWVGYLGLALGYGGFILAIVGVIATAITLIWEGIDRLEKRPTERERPVAEMIFCSYCGTGNVKDAVYCKKCGKKIS